MNILIVSFYDDNFGDNLIKICFRKLLEVALKNLKISDYSISEMPLKRINEDLIKKSDLICFSGGGLLGLSYLNFYEFLNKITEIADKKNIPVIFSSVGVNNMDGNEENGHLLEELLSKKCIKAISVRENFEFFDKYTKDNLKIDVVCDPAVWTKYIYNNDVDSKKEKIVGINVVRGGLFKDNGKEWGLSSEMNYLNELKEILDQRGYKYQFYTNGSFLDNNTLKFYADKYDIPKDQIVLPNTTKEFVEAVAHCSSVVAIRMHSSIVSYSYNIPSVTLVWNDKIPYFYGNIKKENNAIPMGDWNVEKIVEFIEENDGKKFYNDNSKYMMTVYNSLYNNLKKIFDLDGVSYSFSEVVKELEKSKILIDEDILDYKIKLEKAASLYLTRFKEVRSRDKKIKDLETENSGMVEEIKKLQLEINGEKERNAKKEKSLLLDNEEKQKQIEKQICELNELNSLFWVKIRKKIKRIKR